MAIFGESGDDWVNWHIAFSWFFGLLFGVGFGACVVQISLKRLKLSAGVDKEPSEYQVAPWITGLIERSFFTILVGFAGAGSAGAAMVGWLALKMATNWNNPNRYHSSTVIREAVRRHAFVSLLAGMISMSMALLGGLICYYGI